MSKRRTRNRQVNENRSLTLNLPQWDLDTKNHLLISENGTLEGGVEVTIPPSLLAGMDREIATHEAFIHTFKNALPEGERARVYVEVVPADTAPIERYRNNISTGVELLRTLREAKADALLHQRAIGNLVSIRYIILFSTTPNRSFLQRLFARARSTYEKGQYEQLANRAVTARNRLLQTLARNGLAPRRLSAQELFELAWRYFNPHEIMHTPPTFVPTQAHLPHSFLSENPEFSDRTLRSQLTRTGIRRGFEWLRGSKYFTSILTLETLPVGSTWTGMVNKLLALYGTYTVVIDLEHRPQGAAVRELHGRARRMTAAANDPGDLSDYSDPENRFGASESDAALMYVTQTGAHIFKIGLGIIIRQETHHRLEEAVQYAIGALTELPGATYTRENFALLEQYMNLSPGSGQSNDRMFQTLEANATAFLPTSSPWQGNTTNPVTLFQNNLGGLTGLDLFDPKSNNWNGIVVGGSGSGKTFLMQILANELMAQDADIVIVDRGGGYDPLIELHNGDIIPLEPGKVSINPFDLKPGEVAPTDEKRSFLLALLKTMIRTSEGTISGATDTILGAAIDQTYLRATSQIRDENGEEKTIFTGCRLSDLLTTLLRLDTIGERTATDEDKRTAQSIATVLQAWTGDNPLGRFIDAETNIDPTSAVVGFETTGLNQNPQLAPVGIMLIANMVWERAEADPTRKKLVIFDEVWTLLRIPEAANFIVELYRRFRRYGAAAYTVTQSLQDFLTPQARGILQSTTHFFLMKLRGEDKEVKDFFHLNPMALNAFRNLISRKGEFSETLAWILRQDATEGGVLRIRPHPLEYWAFTTDAHDMALRAEILEKHNGQLTAALTELAATHPTGALGAPRNNSGG